MNPEPKKKLIFDAVISLIIENNDYSSITVSGIANRAGIGKGTVYEYFSSKEEIFADAVLDYIGMHFDRTCRLLSSIEMSFKEGFEKMIDYVLEHKAENKLFLNFLFSAGATENSYHAKPFFAKIEELFYRYLNDALSMINNALEKARREGYINSSPSGADIVFAATALADILLKYDTSREEYFMFKMNRQDIKEFCFSKLLKML